MALPMPIPPWLVTRPAEHVQASESGLSAGLQAAHIWAQAAAERARLQEAAKRSDLEAAMEAERMQQKSVYDAQKLAADVAYNKAALSQAQAKIEQTQANAARMAKQWEGQMQLAQQRQAAAEKARADQLALGQSRAAEIARHNVAMESKTKGVPEDAALAAYAKSRQEQPSGPGVLSRIGKGISDFFTGESGEPAPKVGGSPHAEGDYVRNKKDGKLYLIKGGLPVLVDDQGGEVEPTQEKQEE